MSKAGIVAFAFGTPYTIKPNRRIADIASRKARELQAWVYTQPYVSIDKDIVVEYTVEVAENPLPTLRIARASVKWAKQHEISELWIVAALPHLPRALRDVEIAVHKAGADIKVCVCREILDYSEDGWFCPDSIQKRTRSQKAWNRRERFLMSLPFWIYKSKWVAG